MKVILNWNNTVNIPKIYKPDNPSADYYIRSTGYINCSINGKDHYDFEHNEFTNNVILFLDDNENISDINIIIVPYTVGKAEHEESYRIEFKIHKTGVIDGSELFPDKIFYKPSRENSYNGSIRCIYEKNE